MPAPLIKTKTPGIYRRGSRYAVVYRGPDGKQRQESAPTYDAARLLKSKRIADAREGVDNPTSRLLFSAYALDWIDRYPGRGRRGFREQTRKDYRRDLDQYAIPFLRASSTTHSSTSLLETSRVSSGGSATPRRKENEWRRSAARS
jgi:hypothetical protein